jgi:nucleotide-binding universal stress UspA family protein
MSEKKILVPIDFTVVSEKIIRIAATIALKDNLGITLLHIENDKCGEGCEEKLRELSQKISATENLKCDYLIKKGNFFTEIPKVAHSQDYKLMVIGSHGFKGLREKFFGADILKLVKTIPIPALVFQEKYEMPVEGFKTIVFPAGTHDSFRNIIDATIYIAKLFGSTVHLYTVEKPGVEWSAKLKVNIELARERFEANKISYTRVNEEQSSFSVGYSKQIIQFAKTVHADMIALMSIPTKEHYYFADSDKEALLTNDACLPVICTSGEKIV